MKMLEPRYVDSREAEERKLPLERAGFQTRALSSGDVQFPEAGGGTVLIENKKVEQLLEDMRTGQLVKQCRALAEACEFPVLLIEGHWRHMDGSLLGSGYTWEQAWNQLQTLQDLGVRLQLSTDPAHTVRRVLELAEYYGKGIHHSVQRQRGGDVRLMALSLVHGIDKKIGEAILGYYGSLRAVAAAAADDFQAVPGIGPKLAKRLEDFWDA